MACRAWQSLYHSLGFRELERMLVRHDEALAQLVGLPREAKQAQRLRVHRQDGVERRPFQRRQRFLERGELVAGKRVVVGQLRQRVCVELLVELAGCEVEEKLAD